MAEGCLVKLPLPATPHCQHQERGVLPDTHSNGIGARTGGCSCRTGGGSPVGFGKGRIWGGGPPSSTQTSPQIVPLPHPPGWEKGPLYCKATRFQVRRWKVGGKKLYFPFKK